jgi:hypothetical protein
MFRTMIDSVRRLARREAEAGQGLATYGLALAIIAIVAFLALSFHSGPVATILSTGGGRI